MTKKALPAHEVSSGNIFADLGLPNAEEHQLKAALVVQLSRLIKKRKLSQTDAATGRLSVTVDFLDADPADLAGASITVPAAQPDGASRRVMTRSRTAHSSAKPAGSVTSA